ncbi:MAG: hypothetical protein V4469_02970 [Patescibacteria group bacterium]
MKTSKLYLFAWGFTAHGLLQITFEKISKGEKSAEIVSVVLSIIGDLFGSMILCLFPLVIIELIFEALSNKKGS